MSKPARRRRPGHRRALVTVVVVLGVVTAITGGPWVYAQFVVPEPPPPMTVGTTMTTAPPVPKVIDPDGEWVVAEGSEGGYRLHEVLSGNEVVVVGRTEQVHGNLTVRDGLLEQARVVLDVASVTTPESARDAFFRRALDTTTYPEAAFELTEPVDVTGVGGADLDVELVGTLTLRGTSVPTTVTAVVHVGPEGLEVAGTAPITLEDYGLTAPDLPFVTVEPTATIEVLLHLRS